MGIRARFPGMCRKCGKIIAKGEDMIKEDPDGIWIHQDCQDAFVLKPKQPERSGKTEEEKKAGRERRIKNYKETEEKRQKQKQPDDDFFGYATVHNYHGKHNWTFDDYEPVGLSDLLNDYQKNSNKYRFKLFRVPREHQLLTDIGKPALKNHTCNKLVSESDSRDWKPIVFGILGKTIDNEPVMKAFGKINRLNNDDGSGGEFKNNPSSYFYEEICYYQKKQVQKGNRTRHNAPFSMKIHNDDADVIASKAISYFDKEVSPAQFLGLFSNFVKRYYPEQSEDFSKAIIEFKSEKEKIIDKFKNVGKTSEELGFEEDIQKETEERLLKLEATSRKLEEKVEDLFVDQAILPLPSDLDSRIEECTKVLSIDEKYIREILHHLVSGTHVLIGGAIGTGKSHFVRDFLGKFWGTDDNPNGYKVESFTATDEWSTVDVIGGIMPDIKSEDLSYKFQDGCLTETIVDCMETMKKPTDGYIGKWLAIDEFNRADIEKAFGQMFTGIEEKMLKIPGRPDGNKVKIPRQFRIIGMLNTSDKHHLYHIHDALKRRFAYVEIEAPTRKDRTKELRTTLANAIGDIDTDDIELPDEIEDNLEEQMNIAYEMLATIRTAKGLGSAILKVILRELIYGFASKTTYTSANKQSPNNDLDTILDWSLTANLLPQFQGVNKKTLQVFERIFIPETGSPLELFEEAKQNPTEREQFSEGWNMFVKCLNNSDEMSGEEVDFNMQRDKSIVENFQDEWETRKNDFQFSLENSNFAKKLRQLIESEEY